MKSLLLFSSLFLSCAKDPIVESKGTISCDGTSMSVTNSSYITYSYGGSVELIASKGTKSVAATIKYYNNSPHDNTVLFIYKSGGVESQYGTCITYKKVKQCNINKLSVISKATNTLELNGQMHAYNLKDTSSGLKQLYVSLNKLISKK